MCHAKRCPASSHSTSSTKSGRNGTTIWTTTWSATNATIARSHTEAVDAEDVVAVMAVDEGCGNERTMRRGQSGGSNTSVAGTARNGNTSMLHNTAFIA